MFSALFLDIFWMLGREEEKRIKKILLKHMQFNIPANFNYRESQFVPLGGWGGGGVGIDKNK